MLRVECAFRSRAAGRSRWLRLRWSRWRAVLGMMAPATWDRPRRPRRRGRSSAWRVRRAAVPRCRTFWRPAAVSGVCRSDIWAIGSARASGPASDAPAKTQSVAVAMHWNGRSWHVIRYPNLPAVASHTLTGGTIVATGPRDLWVENGIQADGSNTSTELLLHWDGRNWHRVFVPLAPNGVWSMARDGRGGLWLTAEGSGPAGINWNFYHLNGGLLTLRVAPP